MWVNVYQAKTKLSQLLKAVKEGEEIIISKMGQPVAKLVPYSSPKTRKPGVLKGKITIPADFDKEDEKIIKLFSA